MQLNPSDLTIGAPGAPNVISGNLHDGILARVSDAVIQGNLIGTAATGQSAVPNGLSGIHVQVATGVIIGGTAVGAGNLLSGNPGDEIFVGSQVEGAVIQGNLIGTNAAGTAQI